MDNITLLGQIIDNANTVKASLLAPAPQPVPIPVPTPTPSPTPPASSVLVPTVVQNFSVVNGLWTSISGWQNTIADLEYDLKGVGYGSVLTVKLSRLQKYPDQGNWKWLRGWTGQPGNGKPDWFVGQPYPGWTFLHAENLDPTVYPHARIAFNWPWPTGKSRREEYVIRYPSAAGKDNGAFKITLDGQVILNATQWQVDSVDNPGVPNYLCIQDDPSNFVPPSDSLVQIDQNIQIGIS